MSALKRLGINPNQAISEQVYSQNQAQTEKTFGFKWSKRETYESDSMKMNTANWLKERYLKNQPELLDNLLAGSRKIILDAGCGSGYSAILLFGDKLKEHDYLGVDISNAINVAKTRFEENQFPGEFLKSDILQLPIADESIDIIFSEGVLHHTDSTEKALKYLTTKLKFGGHFLFYVYCKKGIIREFTDDYIRSYLSKLSDEVAWEELEALTKLGVELGKLNIEINIPEDISFLGIKKGKIDIQRFFYWNICKAFYKSDYSIPEMNHINFDWFRPANCHRHTPEEIEKWCKEANLRIDHMNIQEAGITVLATKSVSTN